MGRLADAWVGGQQLGRFGMAIMETGVKNFCLALFTRYFGKTVEEVDELCEGVLAEMRQRGVHSYNGQYVGFGSGFWEVLMRLVGGLWRGESRRRLLVRARGRCVMICGIKTRKGPSRSRQEIYPSYETCVRMDPAELQVVSE